jgi:hypothetical protein
MISRNEEIACPIPGRDPGTKVAERWVNAPVRAHDRGGSNTETEVIEMEKAKWVHWLVAAALVLVAGALIATAEERIEVRVEKDGNEQVTVDVNGVTEVIRLDDLAEGESRRFDVGDHELVVTRVGDELTITSDGHGFGSLGHHGKSLDTMIWVSDDGERHMVSGDGTAERRVIVLKTDGGEGEETYTIRVDGEDVILGDDMQVEIDKIVKIDAEGSHPHAIFITEDGDVHHPPMLTTHALHAGLVKYRCDETGSVLLVKEEDAIEDTYICPATGCLMTRVEEPEMRVITIKKRIEIDEDDD